MATLTTGKNQMDMCSGPLFSKIVVFAIPLMLSTALQLIFHAIDVMVIGHYASHESMAAVGATGTLNVMVVNIFGGLSAGVGVFVGRYYGAHDQRRLSRSIHTGMAFAVWGGIVVTILGLFAVKPILIAMQTPSEILPKACVYSWIYYSALPFQLIYNIGSAIMRAVGDTKRPLYYLTIAGVCNVLLNLFFVIVCKMDVAGVAVATAISHVIAAVLLVRAMLNNEKNIRFYWKKMGIDSSLMKDMLKIGIPAAIQSSFFSLSNLIIQSSINSFGSYAMAGSTTEGVVESILHVCSVSFFHTSVAFVAQNRGAGNYKRVLHSIYGCLACATGLCTIVGWSFYIFGSQLMAIFNPDPKVIDWAMQRAEVMFTTYMLLGVMETLNGTLRALGYAFSSMIITLFGACIFRVFWIWTVLPHWRSFFGLFVSYPISWIMVSLLNWAVLYYGLKMLRKELKEKQKKQLLA